MENNSRTKNSFYNSMSSTIVMISKNVLQFVVRTFFIKYLGETYLGVNGLLSNILMMLSIAELGLSSAIGFSLYKPLAKGDKTAISSIMTLFKKIYRVIGMVVSLFGIIVYFFLPVLIKEYDTIPKLNIIYVLYLINTVSTYFISYKDVLITADQKAYKLTKINFIFTLILSIGQIIILIATKSFIAYLIAQFAIQILQRIFTNRYITKEYKDINFSTNFNIDRDTSKQIKNNVKGLMFHKFGDFAVNGTDNIIISYFINIVSVGLYSNYIMITQVIQAVISNVYNAITPSFGNLLVNEKEKSHDIFKKIDFMAFLLYSLFATAYVGCANIFISVWIGEEYVLSEFTVFLIAFSFFITGLRVASYSVKSAAGIYDEDKWSPFVQAIINLAVSIVLAKLMGINGVIIGTIVSSIIPNFTRAYYIYKLVFKEKLIKHFVKYFLPYNITFILLSLVISFIRKTITANGIVGLVIMALISIVVYTIGIVLVFARYSEFKYVVWVAKNLIEKGIKKWRS